MTIKSEKVDDGSEVVNGDKEVEVDKVTAPKKPWVPVYLTSCEASGLQMVVGRMKNWPKTNVPDGIEHPEQLLERLEVIRKKELS